MSAFCYDLHKHVEFWSWTSCVAAAVWMIKVGKESVAVVSPPGTYGDMGHPAVPGAAGDDQQGDQSPPAYSPGLEDSAFSDAVIRRGEGQRK